jgi:polyisoprenoid-binding protein YceI
MRCALGSLAVVCVVIAGCGERPPTPAGAPSSVPTAGASGDTSAAAPAAETGKTSEAGVRTVPIAPENTTITFIGTHAPGAKDPRTGTFQKFSGTADIDAAKNQINSLSIEIDTTSLKAEHEEPGKAVQLTNHLKNPEFLDVEQYPTAKFESTKIEHGPDGAHTVTGNLTLHGVTKEITFPAKAEMIRFVMIFTAEFEIDRMDFGVGDSEAGKGVERQVKIKVKLGKTAG